MTPLAKELIDFWRVRRKEQGLKTIIQPCHEIKADALMSLMYGLLPTPNLMILEPPRVGKTDLVRAWEELAISEFPDSEFLNGSYSDDLATTMTKSIRDTLTASWYREQIRSDWGATVPMRGASADGRQDYFKTLEGGCIKGVGAGSGSLGYGAGKLRRAFGGAVVIDDPLKMQDAKSAKIRKTTVEWIHDALESRRNRKMKPMTPMVLDMQRLHSQDPAGHLLSTERHRWTVVQIPAHDEYNQSIWPSRISIKELMHMKEYNEEVYMAQYMQTPLSKTSNLFLPEWWNFWTDQKEVEKRITLKFITADTAFKEEDSNDYSVFQCWGCEGFRGLYLIDQIRDRWDFPSLIEAADDFLKKHTKTQSGTTPATEAWVEDRASGTSLAQTFKKAGIPFRQWLPPNADQRIILESQKLEGPDKVSRAKQSSLTIKPGRLYLPWPGLPDKKWVEYFINEHTTFTNDNSHLFDDIVDTETCANLIWQQRGGGVGPLPVWPAGQKLKWKDWLERGMVN